MTDLHQTDLHHRTHLHEIDLDGEMDCAGEVEPIIVIQDQIKQFRKLLRLQHGADLDFTPGAIEQIARLGKTSEAAAFLTRGADQRIEIAHVLRQIVVRDQLDPAGRPDR